MEAVSGLNPKMDTSVRKVLSVHWLSKSAFVIRMERGDFEFTPGQHISVGCQGSSYVREYSVYSGINDDYLEILVKKVEEGKVSNELAMVREGTYVTVDGPFGFFTLDEQQFKSRKFFFIATGSGISPFHSFIRSYESIDYTLIHGVRTESEFYDYSAYESSRLVSCTSRAETGSVSGRVTNWLDSHTVAPDNLYYMCGNNQMILQVMSHLKNKGVPASQLFTEEYF